MRLRKKRFNDKQIVVYDPNLSRPKRNKIFSMFIFRISFIISILTSIISIDPLSISTGIAIGGFGYYYKDKVKCYFQECCHNHESERWIANHLDWSDISEEIFGQHIAADVVGKLVNIHLNNKKPSKPLVLSFHGFTGIGKNYLCTLLAKRIYKNYNKTGTSNFVHNYVATHLTKKEDSNYLINDIENKLKECDRSLVIIDEIDKFPEKYLDILLPFLDYGSPFKKSIFIFVGNSAGSHINNEVLKLTNSGKSRQDIEYHDLENIVTRNAIKIGGLKNSELITRGVIDFFIPFLPLSKQHIRQCIVYNLRHKHNFPNPLIDPGSEFILKVIDTIEFNDDDFAIFGCRRVESKVDIFLLK